MSMPGSDMRPDDGPYTECVDCGASIRVSVLADGEEPLCEECALQRELADEDEEETDLPTGPCPIEGAGDHDWTSDEDTEHVFCDVYGTSYEDWAAVEINDLRQQVLALTTQRDAALARQQEG